LIHTHGTLYSIGKQIHSRTAQPSAWPRPLRSRNQEPGWLYEGKRRADPRGSEYDVQFVVDGQPRCKIAIPRLLRTWIPIPSNPCAWLTASYPAEYRRKLAASSNSPPTRIPFSAGTEIFVASGGSFDQLDGSAAISLSREKSATPCARSACIPPGYLDPPVTSNFSNGGNPADFPLHMNETSRQRSPAPLRRAQFPALHHPQRLHSAGRATSKDGFNLRNHGQIYFQHTISSNLMLVSPAPCAIPVFSPFQSFFHPVVVNQDRGYREGYIRATSQATAAITTGKPARFFLHSGSRSRCQYHITDPRNSIPASAGI